LGLAGTISRLKPQAVVIGELGVETRGRRAEISRSISQECGVPCLIGDLGLTLEMFTERCFALDSELK
jgi:hypothetical protein